MMSQSPNEATEKLRFEGAADSQVPGALRNFSSSHCGWEPRKAAQGTGSSWLPAWAAGFPAHAFGSRKVFSSNLLTRGQLLFTMKSLQVFIMLL